MKKYIRIVVFLFRDKHGTQYRIELSYNARIINHRFLFSRWKTVFIAGVSVCE